MCGIVGFKSADIAPSQASKILQKMTDIIAHRGPDGSGDLVVGQMGLGHRRLAVIDLSDRAAQPMQTSDGQLACTFNGEIYNFQSVRRHLKSKGHDFLSDSDTEVLLHGYREWGEDLPKHLDGMFAFAIWDANHETLFLARDRLGKKPLYYAWSGEDFIFASEQKAILVWPGFDRSANWAAIHDYLSFKFTVGAQTSFDRINRLLPGHSMTLTSRHGAHSRPVSQSYWQLSEHVYERGTQSSEVLRSEFFEHFDAAVSKRLIADVPVGAFLSGGVDSTAVVARASSMSAEPLKTFSAGFTHKDFDETSYANRIAEQFGTDHRSFIMNDELAADLPNLVWNYSDPFADSSALVTTALSGEVSKHVKVALSGDGGDEVFLGYQRYNAFANALNEASPHLRSNALGAHLLRLYGPVCPKDIYARSLIAFRDIHKEWGYGAALTEFLYSPSSDRLPNVLDDATSLNAMKCAGLADLEMYLPDDLMVKTDIASMSHGLEVRSPFLDHELVTWASSLPQSARVFDRNGSLDLKALLKGAFEAQISADILDRTKMGFRVPIAHWLRAELKDLAYDLLTSQVFKERQLFRPQFIEWMLEAHVSGREDHSTRIWSLMVLEIWFRTFVDRHPDGPIALPIHQGNPILDEVHA